MSKLQQYKEANTPLPETYAAWQVFGAGIENVGRDGKPVELPLRPPEENEILLRVDVLGLCLSDMKIIAQGGNHARLRGRDLANDPTVLGHECAATVVRVGKIWQDKFKPGERYIVQADIYVNGLSFAFGYLIPGGLAEYAYLDERALDGDDGCYLLPVRPETGYSQSALAEPWACVEMSYCLEDRIRPDGPKQLVICDSPGEWTDRLPRAIVVGRNLETLTDDTFYHIFIPYPSPELVNALAPKLNKNGSMFLLGNPEYNDWVTLDAGSIHYENKRFLGGGDTLDELAAVNKRNDLVPGGNALFIGAGGPMGQMHVQRALEKSDGPACVVVTDLDRARLDHIERSFKGLVDARDVELVTLASTDFPSTDAMNDQIAKLAPGGYNDIVVLAPVPALVRQSVLWAAPKAFINVFAGLGIGTTTEIPLEKLCQGVKIIGCSGSRISDLKRVLELVEAGELDTNRSVAAIGGLNAAQEGLKAVKDARFPGKTVIYTQIRDLPLLPLDEAAEKIPELKPKLSPEGAWTKEAEDTLMEKFLQ